ncbi:MAG: PAS domain S-box protein [Phycisphaerae bacterium]|nr:PAS domain S-box protein [Phycisphaerae bacterium]
MPSPVIISGARRWVGVGVMLATIGVLVLIHWWWTPVPSPPAILVLALVFATFHGGTLPGLASAGLAWVYLTWFLPVHGTDPPDEARANMVRLALWAVSLPASVLLIGSLKHRWLSSIMEARALADAQRALRESQERYRQIFFTNPAPKWVIDVETGAILEANQAAADFYGVPLDRLKRMTVFEVNTAPRERVRAALDEAAAGKSRFEFTHRAGSGEIRDVEVYTGPFDDKGRRCVMSIIHDVTDRRRAEESLRLSERRYRAMSELSTDFAMHATLAPDLTMRITWTVGSFESLTGRTVDQVNVGTGWAESLHLEDVPRAGDHLRDILEGKRVDGEFRLVRPDGGVRWIHAASKPEIDERTGAVTGFYSAVRDITDRRLATEALERSERELRTLLERMPIGWVAFDDQLRFVDLNPTAERIFGRTREELIGRSAMDTIVPDEAKPQVVKILERLQSGDMAAHSTNENVTKDGRRVICRWSNTPLKDEQGRYTGVLSMVEDVTNEHRLEQELRQSQKMDAVGQLASGIAHDFSNLLSAIFGHTSLARRTLDPSNPAQKSLDRVEEAATQAIGVTKALLTFARGGTVEKSDVQMGEVVEETLRLLRRTLPANITIDAEIEPVWVYADPTQIQQVALNLALNARDAMPNGGRLGLRVGPVDGEARLLVSDTGAGMTEEIRRRIFEPFFTTKPLGKGTGLGLAVVHGIVQGHGGRIEVRSEEGKGTEMEVRLPRVQGPRAPALDKPGAGRLALLGEDHRYVREIVGSMLQSLGFEVIHAVDCASLMETFVRLRERVGLVVVDESSPDGSGMACVRKIREMGATTPIVVLASDGIDLGLEGVRPPPCVLRKPFQVGALSDAVKEAQEAGTPEGS